MPNKQGYTWCRIFKIPSAVQLEFSNYLIEDYAIGDFDEAVSKIIERYMKNVLDTQKGIHVHSGGYINS